MFGLGFTEILVILGVALIVLGPEKMPQVAKELGKLTAQFRRAMDQFHSEINMADRELRLKEIELRDLAIKREAEQKAAATSVAPTAEQKAIPVAATESEIKSSEVAQ